MAQKFFNLLELRLGDSEILARALGVAILQRLLGLIQIDLHEFLGRSDVASQVQPLGTERTAHVIEAVRGGIGAAGGLIDVLFQLFQFGLRNFVGAGVALIAAALIVVGV